MKEWKKTGLSTLKKRTRSNRIPDTELAIMTMTIHAAGPSSRRVRMRRPGRMKTDQRKARKVHFSLPERILSNAVDEVTLRWFR